MSEPKVDDSLWRCLNETVDEMDRESSFKMNTLKAFGLLLCVMLLMLIAFLAYQNRDKIICEACGGLMDLEHWKVQCCPAFMRPKLRIRRNRWWWE